jgi:hypothetical protein
MQRCKTSPGHALTHTAFEKVAKSLTVKAALKNIKFLCNFQTSLIECSLLFPRQMVTKQVANQSDVKL